MGVSGVVVQSPRMLTKETEEAVEEAEVAEEEVVAEAEEVVPLHFRPWLFCLAGYLPA